MQYVTTNKSVAEVLRYLNSMTDYYKDSIKYFQKKKFNGFFSFLFKKHNESMDEQIKVCQDEIQVIKGLYDETIEKLTKEDLVD